LEEGEQHLVPAVTVQIERAGTDVARPEEIRYRLREPGEEVHFDGGTRARARREDRLQLGALGDEPLFVQRDDQRDLVAPAVAVQVRVEQPAALPVRVRFVRQTGIRPHERRREVLMSDSSLT
jgi:hypothetical protein